MIRNLATEGTADGLESIKRPVSRGAAVGTIAFQIQCTASIPNMVRVSFERPVQMFVLLRCETYFNQKDNFDSIYFDTAVLRGLKRALDEK